MSTRPLGALPRLSSSLSPHRPARVDGRELRRLRALLGHGGEAVLVLDDRSVVRSAVGAAEAVFGRLPSELVGRRLLELLPPEDHGAFHDALSLAGSDRPMFSHSILRPEGERGRGLSRVLDLTGHPDVRGIVVYVRASERTPRGADFADEEAFLTLVERRLRAPRVTGLFAVLLLQLESLADVRAALGLDNARRVVAQFAHRLESAALPGDRVAQLAPDRFAVLLDSVRDASDAGARAQEFGGATSDSFRVADRDVSVTAKLGLSLSSRRYTDAEAMLRDAGIATRGAAGGRARVANTQVVESTFNRVRVQGALRGAIERREIGVVYQPVVDLRTGRAVGCEALARWKHETLGAIPPPQFILIAERMGIMTELGALILETAVADLAGWRAATPLAHDLVLNVNVSARQLDDPRFVLLVESTLSSHGVPPDRLHLELTEGAFVRDAGTVSERLERLRALGVGVAIDDFGTGYSALAQLAELPADVLKIDRSMVSGPKGMSSSERAAALVRSMIEMAFALGLEVVAEGVETPAQAEQLRALGCRLAQGWLYARPMDADRALEAMTGPT